MASRNVNIDALKLSFVKDFLEIQDVALVNKLSAVLRTALSNPKGNVLGYNIHGTPFTEHDLIETVRQADTDRAEGRLMTIEEFEKEAETW